MRRWGAGFWRPPGIRSSRGTASPRPRPSSRPGWPAQCPSHAPSGDLFLVDRLGDLILVSGFNVYPHEIELVLTGHPAIAEAAVVGVPDPITGQGIRAYVVAAEGGSVLVEDLRAHCEQNLARFKCP